MGGAPPPKADMDQGPDHRPRSRARAKGPGHGPDTGPGPDAGPDADADTNVFTVAVMLIGCSCARREGRAGTTEEEKEDDLAAALPPPLLLPARRPVACGPSDAYIMLLLRFALPLLELPREENTVGIANKFPL